VQVRISYPRFSLRTSFPKLPTPFCPKLRKTRLKSTTTTTTWWRCTFNYAAFLSKITE